MPKISIVIVTFNSEKYIQPCLDSIIKQDPPVPEVILIDNGSLDSSRSIMKDKYPRILLIENKVNEGACRARNQGISAASGEWILVLDCDIVLEAGFLRNSLSYMAGLAPDAGSIQPKILCPDKKTIYSSGIRFTWLGRFYDIGKGKSSSSVCARAADIYGGCAAAVFYRKKMLDSVKDENGYFDERFFFLVEDVDLAFRARQKGWTAKYNPTAVCYHQGDSSRTSRRRRQYLCWRNRGLLLKKCNISAARKTAMWLLYDLPRFCFIFLFNRYARGEILGIFSKIISGKK